MNSSPPAVTGSRAVALEWAAKVTAVLLLGAVVAIEVLAIRAQLPAAPLLPAKVWTSIAAKASNAAFAALMLVLYLARPPAGRKSTGIVPRFAAIVGPLVLPVTLLFVRDNATTGRAIAGASLVALGHVMAVVVLAWLGRSFSMMPEARRLVTTGPYAIVRHPLYLAEAVSAVGLVMQRWSAVSALALAVYVVAQLARMWFEERVLAAEFAGFREYALRTPMLFPWPRRRR